MQPEGLTWEQMERLVGPKKRSNRCHLPMRTVATIPMLWGKEKVQLHLLAEALTDNEIQKGRGRQDLTTAEGERSETPFERLVSVPVHPRKASV